MQIKNQQIFQKELKEGIVKKPVRSVSGVTPLTVVLKPRGCNHGVCIYCPGGEKQGVPQSYTNKSPAIMRAMALNYDPYEQVKARLNVLKKMNHPTDKIEIIVLGGTFLQYEKDYQIKVIKACYDVLNGEISKNLEEAKKLNEKAESRVVALCIENRPDNCSEEEIKRMLNYGCTRVELGVQMPDDVLYKKTNRGHTVKDVVDATQRLKDAGFKVGYHVMPGLPGSNTKKDLKMFKQLFSDEKFRPDQLKLYPCQIVEGAPLAKISKITKYKPYDEKTTKELLEKMLEEIPEYCRVMRMMREFPKEKLVEGLEKLDLRKDVEDDLRAKGVHVKEIRMREVGFNKLLRSAQLSLKRFNYKASEGDEIFLQVVDENDILYGLLRLRLTKNLAMVRELHVYGQNLDIGKKGNKEIAQHKGLGKQLMKEAEKISKENGYKKIVVISGVGVREYYRKIGYKLEGEYMVKGL